MHNIHQLFKGLTSCSRILGFMAIFLTQLPMNAICQQVGIGTNTPQPSAAFEVSSSNKGMLTPRISSASRNAIANPALGLLVFDTDLASFMVFDGLQWRALVYADAQNPAPAERSVGGLGYNSLLGGTVAISANTLICGAPAYSTPAKQNMGAVFVFTKGMGGWQQQSVILPYDSAEGDNFGGSLAISGDYLAVAAVNKTVSGIARAGKVYVYKRNGNAWQRDTVIIRPVAVAWDQFGWSLSMEANSAGSPALAIGVPGADAAGGTDKGEVRIYRRSNQTGKWTAEETLVSPDPSGSDGFGYAVSIDKDYIAIGAPFHTQAGSPEINMGAAYVYVYGGAFWNFRQKLMNNIPESRFGHVVVLDSTRLAVGAPFSKLSLQPLSSSVHTYIRQGPNWTNGSTYQASIFTGQNRHGFGLSLAFEGNFLLIGAPAGYYNPGGSGNGFSNVNGEVYVLADAGGNQFKHINTLRQNFPNSEAYFGTSIGISGNQYVIGEPQARFGDKFWYGKFHVGIVQ
jgi:hypothetical protein